MARVTVFVDGFNVYHALDSQRAYHRYKWLDYAALARCYVGSKDKVERVWLFTAYATWNPDKVKRHQAYVRVLQHRGVELVTGKFKRKDRVCRLCHRQFQTFEEKYTDVNIAIHLLRGAYLDEFDKAILISADTDIIPALLLVRELFPTKQVGVVIPIGSYGMEMKQVCDFHFQMKERQLARSQLPDVVDVPGLGPVRRPETWV